MNAPMGKGGRGLTEGHFGERRSGGPLGLFAPAFRAMLDRVERGLEAGSLELLLPNGTHRLMGGRNLRPWLAHR